LYSEDGRNRLSRAKVELLTAEIRNLCTPRLPVLPLIISGEKNFSVGADLNEIAQLTGPEALEFSKTGQQLMQAVSSYPATVIAAINGYCMGGGLDLALACDRRIASKHSIFGHRGAALGLITGWGGTQRLPRIVGKARALEMFMVGEKLDVTHALRFGLIDAIADDPVAAAIDCVTQQTSPEK
jgi:enoyl-CoA hydratase